MDTYFSQTSISRIAEYLVRRDVRHQIHYHINNICTFKRVGKIYAYLSINSKNTNGIIYFTLVIDTPWNWSWKIYDRNGTDIFSTLSLNFPQHIPQRTRRFSLAPPSEPGNSVIVQNGARVCDMVNNNFPFSQGYQAPFCDGKFAFLPSDIVFLA